MTMHKKNPQQTLEKKATTDGKLHPRNRHLGRYDFTQLIKAEESLSSFVKLDQFGEQGIDFANNHAIKALNRALLKDSYGIVDWDIPAHNLCPPVPGRADYVHYVADLIVLFNNGKMPKKKIIQALDIGTGANLIYPLIGSSEYGWHFVASDINADSLANAQKIIDHNPQVANKIELRIQTSSNAIFKGIVQDDEWFDISMCNPPFHTSLAKAKEGTQRKWQNLAKTSRLQQNQPNEEKELDVALDVELDVKFDKELDGVHLNFGGQDAELWCQGGELAFIERMIKESAQIPTRCFWFTTLVSKSAHLDSIEIALKQAKVSQHKTIAMSQGQKQSRLVAWTFLNPAQQAAWRQLRW